MSLLEESLSEVQRRLERFWNTQDKRKESDGIRVVLLTMEQRIETVRQQKPKKASDVKRWGESVLHYENAHKLLTDKFRTMASRTLLADVDDKGQTTDVKFMDTFSPLTSSGGAEMLDSSMARGQIIRTHRDVTEETYRSILASQGIVQRTEIVAMDIQAELGRQGEKIIEIDKELDDMESHIVRAKRELKYFARQMARDKMFSTIFVLVIIIGIIIFVIEIVKVTRSSPAPIPTNSTQLPTSVPRANIRRFLEKINRT